MKPFLNFEDVYGFFSNLSYFITKLIDDVKISINLYQFYIHINTSICIICITSLLISHNIVVMIFVNAWMFIITFALKSSIFSLTVLPHTTCAKERFCRLSIYFEMADLNQEHPYKQHYDFHYSRYISILILDRCRSNLCYYSLDIILPLVYCSWSDDQFYCMCNIYKLVYSDVYNLLRLFFWLFIINAPF